MWRMKSKIRWLLCGRLSELYELQNAMINVKNADVIDHDVVVWIVWSVIFPSVVGQ